MLGAAGVTGSGRAIRHLVVAVPAKDEEVLLPGCLHSVSASVAVLSTVRPDVTACVVVALDSCTDGSAEVARAHGALAVRSPGSGVGTARDTAIRQGLDHLAVQDHHAAWVACTDADSRVPSNWLVHQVMWAERDVDLVVGTVEPFDAEDPMALLAWQERHHLAEGHQYVHGANLGVRSSMWRDVGGFGPRTLHEDVSLVGRVRARTPRWVATDTTRVRTSGRSHNRVPGGFGGFIRGLGSA